MPGLPDRLTPREAEALALIADESHVNHLLGRSARGTGRGR
jgi:hypothetical protein